MKKMTMGAALAAVALLCGGCASEQVAQPVSTPELTFAGAAAPSVAAEQAAQLAVAAVVDLCEVSL